MEQREFLKTIPDIVAQHQTQIDQAMSDYDMIDDYYYTLSNDDFNNRSVWTLTSLMVGMYFDLSVVSVYFDLSVDFDLSVVSVYLCVV